jgi:hypothetical protein
MGMIRTRPGAGVRIVFPADFVTLLVDCTDPVVEKMVAWGLEEEIPAVIVIDVDLHVSVAEIPGVGIPLISRPRIFESHRNVVAASVTGETDFGLGHRLLLLKFWKIQLYLFQILFSSRLFDYRAFKT